jgi:pectinesterase
VEPYINMREAYPWQTMRFREYANSGPGAVISVPENRPQLTDAEAESHTREAYLGDWRPVSVAAPDQLPLNRPLPTNCP